MKVNETDTDYEYKLEKEKPFEHLMRIETAVILGVILVLLLFFRVFIIIPILAFLIFLATVQTIEDNFKIVINKNSKEIKIFRYYMGRWKVKTITIDGTDYASVQVEKMVTSIKEDGRFAINLLTEATTSENKGESLVLMKNLDLDDIPYAKTMSFVLGLLYETRIKYRAGLID